MIVWGQKEKGYRNEPRFFRWNLYCLYYTEIIFNMILGCDIPLVPNKLLSELIEKYDDETAITILSSESRIYPLIGICAK
jgi:hypothetical protein